MQELQRVKGESKAGYFMEPFRAFSALITEYQFLQTCDQSEAGSSYYFTSRASEIIRFGPFE